MASKKREPVSEINNRVILAEICGTFVLTFIDGVIPILNLHAAEKIGIFARSFAASSVVATIIFCFGNISGAHINPAVTLAFALRRDITWKRAAFYITGQIFGATLAGCLMLLLFKSEIGAAVNTPIASVSRAAVFELILTCFLISAILMSAIKSNIKGWQSACPVSLTLLFCGIVGRSVSGSSFNPARSLGPALVSGRFENIWLYIFMPISGALLAVMITYLINGKTPEEEKSASGN